MLNFIGYKSLSLVIVSGLIGFLLAGVEIILSAYLVGLLNFVGLGESELVLFDFFPEIIKEPLFFFFGFVVVTILRSVLHIGKGYVAVSANELFVSRLRLVCISSAISKNDLNVPTSRTFSLVSDVFLKSGQAFYSIAHAIPLALQAFAIYFYMLSVSSYLSYMGLFFILISSFVVFFLQKRISRLVNPLSRLNDGLYKNVKKILDNILLIRLYSLERLEKNNVASILTDYLARLRRSNFYSLLSENIPSALGSVVISALFYFQYNQNAILPEVFIGFVYLFVRFIQSLSQVIGFTSSAIMNWPYFSSSYSYFKTVPISDVQSADSSFLKNVLSDVNDHESTYPSKFINLNAPSIKADGLSYDYDLTSSLISNLSFLVPSGAQCVIIGPSGSGKSTLLNLIAGEASPISGYISINDESPDSFLRKYSDQISYAGPEPLLFEGSLRENLLYGTKNDIEDEEIFQVLCKLGLYSWLERIDRNLDIPVNAKGAAISSGQAQRLSIARALLRKPKLLILDEVTSNLDDEAEELVLNLLLNLKGLVTVLVVTHSKKMQRDADLIVKLA